MLSGVFASVLMRGVGPVLFCEVHFALSLRHTSAGLGAEVTSTRILWENPTFASSGGPRWGSIGHGAIISENLFQNRRFGVHCFSLFSFLFLWFLWDSLIFLKRPHHLLCWLLKCFCHFKIKTTCLRSSPGAFRQLHSTSQIVEE
jgi:hypothetical protein